MTNSSAAAKGVNTNPTAAIAGLSKSNANTTAPMIGSKIWSTGVMNILSISAIISNEGLRASKIGRNTSPKAVPISVRKSIRGAIVVSIADAITLTKDSMIGRSAANTGLELKTMSNIGSNAPKSVSNGPNRLSNPNSLVLPNSAVKAPKTSSNDISLPIISKSVSNPEKPSDSH